MKFAEHQSDIYILGYDNYNDILYSPLRGIYVEIGHSITHEIISFFRDKQPLSSRVQIFIEQILKIEKGNIKNKQKFGSQSPLVVIPTQGCNLNCEYCFSHIRSKLKEPQILTFEQVKPLLDGFTSNTGETRHISFLGGGEPLLNWSLITQIIEYCETRHRNVTFGLTTNATLLTESKIEWLHSHKVALMVSCEILEDIQNKLRPLKEGGETSYKLIESAIISVLKHYKTIVLRSTITSTNVDRMKEMVEFVATRFPSIKKVHFEMVADNSQSHKKFYEKYIDNYFEAIEIGEKLGIKVVSMLHGSFFTLKNGVCHGEYCITPSGNLIGCHRHSKINDDYHNDFKFGFIKNGEMFIDQHKLDSVGEYSSHPFSECKSCFAQYHCTGGCRSLAKTYSIDLRKEYCEFVRKFYKRLILTKLQTV